MQEAIQFYPEMDTPRDFDRLLVDFLEISEMQIACGGADFTLGPQTFCSPTEWLRLSSLQQWLLLRVLQLVARAEEFPSHLVSEQVRSS